MRNEFETDVGSSSITVSNRVRNEHQIEFEAEFLRFDDAFRFRQFRFLELFIREYGHVEDHVSRRQEDVVSKPLASPAKQSFVLRRIDVEHQKIPYFWHVHFR